VPITSRLLATPCIWDKGVGWYVRPLSWGHMAGPSTHLDTLASIPSMLTCLFQ